MGKVQIVNGKFLIDGGKVKIGNGCNCCEVIECRTSGLNEGCNSYFSTTCCGRWPLCVSGEVVYTQLNATTPVVLVRTADNVFTYEEATVRKYVLTLTPGNLLDAGNIKSYRWDGAAWVQVRSINADIGRVDGYQNFAASGASYKIYAIDPWYPDTMSITFSGITLCSGCSFSGYYNGNFYSAEVASLSVNTTKTLTLHGDAWVEANFGVGDSCGYSGRITNGVTLDLHTWGTGCTDLVQSVSLDVWILVYAFTAAGGGFSVSMGIVTDGASWNTDNRFFYGEEDGAGAPCMDCDGETIAGIAQIQVCGDHPSYMAENGSASITIGAVGS